MSFSQVRNLSRGQRGVPPHGGDTVARSFERTLRHSSEPIQCAHNVRTRAWFRTSTDPKIVRGLAVAQSGQRDAFVLRLENGKIIGRFSGLRANRGVQKVRCSRCAGRRKVSKGAYRAPSRWLEGDTEGVDCWGRYCLGSTSISYEADDAYKRNATHARIRPYLGWVTSAPPRRHWRSLC